MNNNTQTVWLVAVAAITVIGLSWAIAWGATIASREAIKNGYIEVSVPLNMTTKWVKP